MATAVPIRFQILEGQTPVREEVIEEPVIKIGRLANSHLVLKDESVARMHAVIEIVAPDDVLVIDLGSTQGTKVNGERINKAKVQNGDRLSFGAVDVLVSFPKADPRSQETPRPLPRTRGHLSNTPEPVNSAVRQAQAALTQEREQRTKIQTRLEQLEVDQKQVQDKFQEAEKARAREEEARKAAEVRLKDSEAKRAQEEEERKLAQARAEDLETGYAKTKEMRDEIARLREIARTQRDSFDQLRRSSMFDLDTQKARRNLVSASAVALIFSLGHLVPSEINVFGIKFDKVVPSSILLGAIGVLVYLLMAFGLKAWDAAQVWRSGIAVSRMRLEKIGADRRLGNLESQLPDDVALVRALVAAPERIPMLTPAAISDLAMPLVLALAAITSAMIVR
jgi:pSer/pThr/pTyr-binding forkhead associated (FHA) protein